MNALQRSVFEAAVKLCKTDAEKEQIKKECSHLTNKECWETIARLNRIK